MEGLQIQASRVQTPFTPIFITDFWRCPGTYHEHITISSNAPGVHGDMGRTIVEPHEEPEDDEMELSQWLVPSFIYCFLLHSSPLLWWLVLLSMAVPCFVMCHFEESMPHCFWETVGFDRTLFLQHAYISHTCMLPRACSLQSTRMCWC